jgi:hypothetical protein
MKKAILIILLFFGSGIFQVSFPANALAPGLNYEGVWGSGPCMDVAYDGNYAYYLGWRTGLEVLDVTAPERPVKIAGLYVPAHPTGVMPAERQLLIRDGYGYITAYYYDIGDSILQIVDLGNPSAPKTAGHLVFSGHVTGLAVNGGNAFVSVREGGVKIIDVSIPFSPQLVATHFIDGNTYDVAARNNHNFVYAVNKNSMRIIDVSAPASPLLVGTYTLTDNDISSLAIGENGDFAFIGGYGGLVTVDITDPTAPVETNFYPLPYIGRVKIKNNIAHVCASNAVFLLDIASPSSPRELGSWHAFQSVLGTAMADGYLYAANYVDGVRVLDISDISEPKAIGAYNQVTEDMIGVTVRDSMVYSLHTSNVYVIDAGNSSYPYMKEKSSYLGSRANSLRLRDHYAYHTSNVGFRILDISNPRHPLIVGRYAGQWYKTYGLVLGDEHAYTVKIGNRLEVIDISDPTNPEVSSSLDGIAIGGIAKYQDYAYVISSAAGLQVIDISNPQSPSLAGIIPVNVPAETTGWPEMFVIEPVIQGTYLYIPGHRGLEVLDISNPAAPVPVAVGVTGQTATAAAVNDDYAYVVLHNSGLQIFDISQPTSPRPAGTLDIPHGARHVHASGNNLYITSLNNQVHIYRTGQCKTALIDAPSGGKICTIGSMQDISWTVPETGADGNYVNLELYQDNHRVATIAENLPAASGTFSWPVGAAVNTNILVTPGNRFNIGVRLLDDNCLTLSQGHFTIPEPGVALDIEVEKGIDSSPFFYRWCVKVSITVNKEPGAVDISHFILRRSTEHDAFQWIDLIPGDLVQNGSYSYFDCGINEYYLYDYYLEAIHPTGAIIATSIVKRIEGNW